MIGRLTLFFLICASSTVASAEHSGMKKGARVQISDEEAKSQILVAQKRIVSWAIEYKSLPKSSVDATDGAYVHRIIIARSPDCYSHWGAKGNAGFQSIDDPFQQHFVMKSTTTMNEFPLDRVIFKDSLAPADPLPGSMPEELLFAFTGWWPFPDKPCPTIDGKVSTSLARIAQSKHYQLQEFEESVSGVNCHVLSFEGRDRLWLDPKRGWAIIARELYGARGVVLQRLECGELTEAKPRIWVPTRVRNLINNELGDEMVNSTLALERIQVNIEIPEDTFEIIISPGAIGELKNGSIGQISPGGTDLFSKTAGNKGRPSKPDWRSMEIYIESGVSILCIAYLAHKYFFRREKKHE